MAGNWRKFRECLVTTSVSDGSRQSSKRMFVAIPMVTQVCPHESGLTHTSWDMCSAASVFVSVLTMPPDAHDQDRDGRSFVTAFAPGEEQEIQLHMRFIRLRDLSSPV